MSDSLSKPVEPVTSNDRYVPTRKEVEKSITELRGIAKELDRPDGWGIASVMIRGAAIELEQQAAEIERQDAHIESLQNRWATRPLSHPDGEALIAENERLRAENQALRNLANNLRPGPISAALAGDMAKEHERAGIVAASRDTLRRLIDLAWNEATESKEVPDYEWADRIIARWRADVDACTCPNGNPDGPLGMHNECPLHGFEGTEPNCLGRSEEHARRAPPEVEAQVRSAIERERRGDQDVPR